MKAMYLAFLSIVVIALAANLALRHAGFSTSEITSSPDVRLN